MLATVSNKRLEKAVDVKVNLIGVDKLRVKAGRISDDNNFEFGYNGGYLYNLYLTPITQNNSTKKGAEISVLLYSISFDIYHNSRIFQVYVPSP